MQIAMLTSIPDTTLITAIKPDGFEKKKKGYASFVVDNKEVVMYA